MIFKKYFCLDTIVSALPYENDNQRASETGADGYITKPFGNRAFKESGIEAKSVKELNRYGRT